MQDAQKFYDILYQALNVNNLPVVVSTRSSDIPDETDIKRMEKDEVHINYCYVLQSVEQDGDTMKVSLLNTLDLPIV